ncbi:MAG: asparagine synthase (glutamine-hydrolyzing) [Candidatus Eisenbacteria bacterium]|uniref:asparagine synthase (glutamine-hydrolyzing) n=1 Tax=Eiseniibacteriota bacterium TaxID=2212470 RepID=A0A849SQU9_UNCEI|nr:asparagine synthase (glutamine-hydrolyzing) [Candidatus Eisenbacteria bacterium]
MCGIAGVFDPAGGRPAAEWLDQACARLAHRGPDDDGVHLEDGVGLAFRRLAIVDLATGAQPLSNETGDVWIVFNGEIYNHVELRRELEGHGHRYRTLSDTESIVHGYEQWGDAVVEHLRGMFAFAIWDRPRRRLLCARDRLGIKPLYFTRAQGRVLFASEIKALFAFPGVERRVRVPSLVEHLTLRYTAAPDTLFDGIEKLPPGHLLIAEASGITTRRFWDVAWEPKLEIGEADALTEVESRLREAVRLRLMSEVPLGALLSGGVDSSLIVSFMSELVDRPVQTFSVGFDAPGPYSELPFARRVAEHCRTDHREIMVTAADLLRELPRLVWHQDEPLSEPAAIPTYLVSQLARETVTVVLTGEGGDELFAGYPKYAVEPWARTLSRWPAALRSVVLDGFVDRLPFGFRKLQVVARSARFRDEAERLSSWFAGFAGEERRRLLAPELAVHDRAGAAAFGRMLAETTARRPLDRMLDVDRRLWLPDDLLMKMDKMSMAASIEARVPLLDHPLVEWAARLPDRLKVRGLTGKWLLKQLAYRRLPHEIIDRPKVGFTVPLSPWFRGPLRELVADTLLSPTCLGRGYWRPDALRAVVEDHLSGRRDRARELWTLLTLELWHRNFIDRVPEPAVPYHPPARAHAGAR